MTIEWDMILRLSFATLMGGLIGLERERQAQAAGLRTHMVVATASALIMVVSITTALKHGGDPSRIAAQVVSGIGFLGAGAILRFGMSVKGLTTAASLWAAAGIGLAAGLGYFQGALVATALVLIATFVFDLVEKRFLVGKHRKRFVIHGKSGEGILGKIEKILSDRNLPIKQLGLHEDREDGKIEISFFTVTPDNLNLGELSSEISSIEQVESIDID